MTPNDINVLLHYYTTPGEHPRVHAPAVREAIESFLARGIFEWVPDLDTPHVSDKGRKLVEMLCATPDPVNKWLDPRTPDASTNF